MDDHEGVSQAPVASNNAGKGKNINLILDVHQSGGLRGAVARCYCDIFYMCVRMYVCDDIEIAGVM